FLCASARPVTCGIGGGNNCGFQADVAHVVCLSHEILCPLYWLKQSLSQVKRFLFFAYFPFSGGNARCNR
ncbi:hypothetical protein, partial [Enterobacter hormaechei]|uniref:hypothetical protein n=1 Tax=Enterobacter hormaechei TaxID=158836 RepID=UPI003CC69F7D